ncbi:phosphoglycerate kinase [Candidatus Micrarchaeota archaeon]|nr:phosphoglycerate kinase [Candidatus Micrarchaeota archaeon]
MGFFTLDSFNLEGKTVFVRVDMNSPIDEKTGKILATNKIEASIPTMKELMAKKAKVVLTAHQGQPGEYDYVSLEQHAKILSNLLGTEVLFLKGTDLKLITEGIKKLRNGQILLLDNIRFFNGEVDEKAPEEHAKSEFVTALKPLIDYFINDAFPSAHRSHISVVGFSTTVPMVAGRGMEKELKSLEKIVKNPAKPVIFVLGGAKISDSVKLMEKILNKKLADKIIVGGLLSTLLLYAKGYPISDATLALLEKKKGLEATEKVKKILNNYTTSIELPVDVAIEENGKRKEVGSSSMSSGMAKDIGSKTIENYIRVIKTAKTIITNGPMGVYEEKEFSLGTRKILEAITLTDCFSSISGGNTVAALDASGISRDKVSYISLAGKAFLNYVSGDKLPAVEALEISYRKFKSA